MADGGQFKMATKILQPVFLPLILCFFLILTFKESHAEYAGIGHRILGRYMPGSARARDILRDIVASCWRALEEIEYVKQTVVNTAPFEIGYIVQIVQDKYRKMVDRYHSVRDVAAYHFYLFEMIVFLEEIEHGYWQLDHILSMLHEVEKKYEIHTTLHHPYVDLTRTEQLQEGNTSDLLMNSKEWAKHKYTPTRITRTRKKFRMSKLLAWAATPKRIDWNEFFTTKERTGWRFPRDYGWDIDEW